jgi:hypothetical protein
MSRSILLSFFQTPRQCLAPFFHHFFYQVILDLNCVPLWFKYTKKFFFHLHMNAGIFRQINDSGSHRDDGVTEDKFVAGVLLKEK